MKSHLYILHISLVIVALCLLSCSADQSPEEEIVEFINDVQKQVEKKSISGLRKLISDGYSDNSGFAKSEILRIASGYFLRKKSISTVYTTTDVFIQGEGNIAELTVYAAVSDTQLEKDDVRLLQAEFHQFDIRVEKSTDWQLKSLKWQRSNSDDFSNAAD